MDDEERFWRSAAGRDQFELALDAHFQKFLALGCDMQTIEGRSFDAVVIRAYPEPGFSTLVTRGLSAFILPRPSPNARAVREELVWTLSDRDSAQDAAGILFELGERLLAGRRSLSENEVVDDIDFSTLRAGTATVQGMLTMLNHWLEPGLVKIPNYFIGYFVELVPVTAQESRLISRNLQAFLDLCRNERIDTFDLSRAPAD